MGRLDERELLRLAKRAGLSVRTNGGHAVVTMPDGRPLILRPPGRKKDGRKLSAQVKRFRAAGLLDSSDSSKQITDTSKTA